MEKASWDGFHKTWISIVLLLGFLVGCTSCSTNETKMVDEMAENCRGGMNNARVHKEGNETDVYVGCK